MQPLLSILVVFGAAFVLVHCEQRKPKHWDTCAREHNLPREFKGPDYSKATSEASENRKCFEKCLLIKGGLMNIVNEVNWQRVEDIFLRVKPVKPLAENCGADSKFDFKSCDYVYDVMKCVSDNGGVIM